MLALPHQKKTSKKWSAIVRYFNAAFFGFFQRHVFLLLFYHFRTQKNGRSVWGGPARVPPPPPPCKRFDGGGEILAQTQVIQHIIVINCYYTASFFGGEIGLLGIHEIIMVKCRRAAQTSCFCVEGIFSPDGFIGWDFIAPMMSLLQMFFSSSFPSALFTADAVLLSHFSIELKGGIIVLYIERSGGGGEYTCWPVKDLNFWTIAHFHLHRENWEARAVRKKVAGKTCFAPSLFPLSQIFFLQQTFYSHMFSHKPTK